MGWPDGSWRYDEHADFGALAAGAWTIDFGLYVRPVAAVEGATEHHRGLRKALHEIVQAYPELLDFAFSFDGPPRAVHDLLDEDVPSSMRDVMFMHGTSSATLPLIKRDGLRPRGDTGSAAAFGLVSSAAEGRADAVYLTTQKSMARHAAHDAVRQFGGEPVVVHVTGLDPRRMAPDEDSRRTTAEESLAVLGSVAYVGTIPPDKIVNVEWHESAERANPDEPLSLKKRLLALRPQLAAAAQAVYDEWAQDEDGVDEWLGTGGICQDIADAFSGVLSTAGIDSAVMDNEGMGEQHVWAVAYDGSVAFIVDIPPAVYETGGGYSWRKREGVEFAPGDILLADVSGDFDSDALF